MPSMLEHALRYAKRGWPIFPCNREKEPIGTVAPNGVLDATTDEKTIRKWWDKYPQANIGLDVTGAGLLAGDFDPGSKLEEVDAAVDGLPDTGLVQRTPRGGSHHFYRIKDGETIANSVKKVAPGFDVRGLNGYVLLAPSKTIDGEYSWVSDGKPAMRTDRMVEVFNTAREKSKDRDNWIIEADLRENVERAVEWLEEKAKIAVEGQGGDHIAYATAAYMKSLGISVDKAVDIMWEHWNPRCDPPWGPDEFDHFEQKVFNAYAYNTSPPGNLTTAFKEAKAKEKFKPVVNKDLSTGTEIFAGRFRFADREAITHIRPPNWLIPGFLPAGGYATIFGAPGTFKSFLALDVACSVATGSVASPQGDETWPVIGSQGPVLYIAGEGRPEFKKRLRAWEKTFLDGKSVKDFILADPVPSVMAEEEIEGFIDGALELYPEGYKLVVVDTTSRAMMGADENNQKDASKFTRMVEKLQNGLGCTVLAVQHQGHEDDKRRAKGSSEFQGAPDTIVGVRRDDKSYTVELYMTKQKDAPEWEKSKMIALKEIELGDGQKSLVAMLDTKAAPPDEEKQAKKAKKQTMDGAVTLVIDAEINKLLKAFPAREWTQRQLAEALAMKPNVDISSKTLQNTVLRELRENKTTKAHGLYDAEKRVWRWREA